MALDRYKVPMAGRSTLGGVKVGKHMAIDKDGTLDVKSLTEIEETLDEVLPKIAAGKRKIAAALTGKGVETAEDATFDVMAENIDNIGGGVSLSVIATMSKQRHYTIIEEG